MFSMENNIPAISITKLTLMADVEIKNKKGKHPGRASQKKSTKVDLTPMVDLGFLLITFFVFTTTMAQAKVMEIKTPDDTNGPGDDICNSCALTVLLDKNDAVYYYEGAFDNASIQKTDFVAIRDIIQNKKQQLKAMNKKADNLALIIKSADSSSFRNFVDITDEVTINNVKHYYIDELTAEEKTKMNLLRQ